MVPVEVTSTQAKIISRQARDDEIVELANRIISKGRQIELDLLTAGAPSPNIGETTKGIGLKVHEDLGYNVLRREFGLDGQRMQAHWRPAFKKTKAYANKSMAKVAEYITTGKKNVFDLPLKTDRINSSIVRTGEGFAKEIAPFMK